MIGRLTGKIIEKTPPLLLLDVSGVGYELQAPMTTFYTLPSVGETTTLYTHMAVREDAHLLYGFSQQKDRQLFRIIIKVSGVGPKIGLAILSAMDAASFVHGVRSEDTASLVRIPGVGKKMAERLVVELRSHLKDWVTASPAEAGPLATQAKASASRVINAEIANTPEQEALHVLLALGYKFAEAQRKLDTIKGQADTTEDLVRLALRMSN